MSKIKIALGIFLAVIPMIWPDSVPFGVQAILIAAAIVIAGWGVIDLVRERLRNRPLSVGKVRALTSSFKDQQWEPETVTIRYKNGCDRCRADAVLLADALTSAGWRGEIATTPDQSEGNLNGIHFVVGSLSSKPNSAKALASAFRQAGIPFQWSTWDPPLTTPVVLFVYPQA